MSGGLSQPIASRVRTWLGIDDPARAPHPQPIDSPPIDVSGLEKQIAKLGREQFKLNALLESQNQHVQAALQSLCEQSERQERDITSVQTRHLADMAEARLQTAMKFVPVLDGLDEALLSARKLFGRSDRAAPAAASAAASATASATAQRLSWVKVLAIPAALASAIVAMRRRDRQAAALSTAHQPPTIGAARYSTAVAWLGGLEMVRARMLQTLAAEGITPIASVGQLFDPRLHVAVDTAPVSAAAPAGTIVTELRRGYAVASRILRYAEVVVARDILIHT